MHHRLFRLRSAFNPHSHFWFYRCAGGCTEQAGKAHVGYSAQAGIFSADLDHQRSGHFKSTVGTWNCCAYPADQPAAAALLSGEVPITVVGGPAVVSSNIVGSDLVMIAGIVNTFAFQIVTVKGITTYQQLKGKRLGVNRFGASPDVAARFALKHMGIDPKEVTLLQLGEQSTRLQAMMAGQLEAAVFLPPTTTIALKQGMNVLLDLAVGRRVSDHRTREQSKVSRPTTAHGAQVHAGICRRHSLLQDAQTREHENHCQVHED